MAFAGVTGVTGVYVVREVTKERYDNNQGAIPKMVGKDYPLETKREETRRDYGGKTIQNLRKSR